MPRRKVFIVEDHPVFRQGLAQVIGAEEDLTVCGEAEDAQTALEHIARLSPDIALVDISLPGKNGLELLKDLRTSGNAIKVLVISMHDEALYADRVLSAGGDGYIMKQEDPDEIVAAIRDILSGHLYVSEQVLAAERGPTSSQSEPTHRGRPLEELTDLELEVLELVGRGKSNSQISAELAVPTAEIARLIKDIQNKLRFSSLKEVFRYAVCWVETGVT